MIQFEQESSLPWTEVPEAINPSNLQRITQEAIERGTQEAERLRQQRLSEEQLRKEAVQRKAVEIIQQIPTRAEFEARHERRFAIVMSFDSFDFQFPPAERFSNKPRAAWLKEGTVTKIVYDYCQNARLRPSLEYWLDGCGMDSGYNIVIHW